MVAQYQASPPTMNRSRATKVARPQPALAGCYVQDSSRESIAHDVGDGNIFFPSVDAAVLRNIELQGEHVLAYNIQAARVPLDNMCGRPADLIANYQSSTRAKGGGC